MKPTILLSDLTYFDFTKPNEEYSVANTAAALSKICRFTGQTSSFYSVAQHAVLVSKLVAPEFAYEALHHDDSEAYLGDVSTPLKQLLPDYRAIEHNVEQAVRKFYGLPEKDSPEVKAADYTALKLEKFSFFEDGTDMSPPWDWLEPYEVDYTPIIPLPSKKAEHLYLLREAELTGKKVEAYFVITRDAWPREAGMAFEASNEEKKMDVWMRGLFNIFDFEEAYNRMVVRRRDDGVWRLQVEYRIV